MFCDPRTIVLQHTGSKETKPRFELFELKKKKTIAYTQELLTYLSRYIV